MAFRPDTDNNTTTNQSDLSFSPPRKWTTNQLSECFQRYWPEDQSLSCLNVLGKRIAIQLSVWASRSDRLTNELPVCLHQGGERLPRPNQRLSAACRCRGLVVRSRCSASGPDRELGDGTYRGERRHRWVRGCVRGLSPAGDILKWHRRDSCCGWTASCSVVFLPVDMLIDNRAALLCYLLMQADMLATSSRRLELLIYIKRPGVAVETLTDLYNLPEWLCFDNNRTVNGDVLISLWWKRCAECLQSVSLFDPESLGVNSD